MWHRTVLMTIAVAALTRPSTGRVAQEHPGAGLLPEEAVLSDELHPSWSPEGDRLVFESNRNGKDDLFVIEVDSGVVTRLTDSSANDARPVWSPSGEWIAFHSDRSGNFDVYRTRPDGTEVRRVTDRDLDETSPAWSPDSKKLAYEVRRDHHWFLSTTILEDGSSQVLLDRPGSHFTPAWLSKDELVFSYSPPAGNHDTDIVLVELDTRGTVRGELLGGLAGNLNANYSPRRHELVCSTRSAMATGRSTRRRSMAGTHVGSPSRLEPRSSGSTASQSGHRPARRSRSPAAGRGRWTYRGSRRRGERAPQSHQGLDTAGEVAADAIAEVRERMYDGQIADGKVRV